MKINTKTTVCACSFLSVLILSGCSGYINRDLREANNDYRYLDSVYNTKTIVQPANTDPIIFDKSYDLPDPIVDSRAALIGKVVDIRPPQKLIPINSNLIAFQDGDLSQVWFYPDESGKETTPNDLLIGLLSFLNTMNIGVDDVDALNSTIQTGWFDSTEYGSPYDMVAMNDGLLLYRQRYLIRLLKNRDGVPGIAVQLSDNIIETSDGTELEEGLNRYEPARFSTQMANRIMFYYAQLKKRAENPNYEYEDIDITLDRDNNKLPCWTINASFEETYKVMTQLFLDYDFEIKEYSSSKGEILIDYDEEDSDFWEEHQTETWAIDSGVYLFKLGVYEGKTTITLYDKNKVAVPKGLTTRMYSGFALSLKREFYKYRHKK